MPSNTPSQIHLHLKVKVKVPVYSLISTHIIMHVQPTIYPPGTVLPQGRTRTIDPTLDSCTRYPSLLGGQESGRNFLVNSLNALGFEPATPELDDQRLRPLSHHSTRIVFHRFAEFWVVRNNKKHLR